MEQVELSNRTELLTAEEHDLLCEHTQGCHDEDTSWERKGERASISPFEKVDQLQRFKLG